DVLATLPWEYMYVDRANSDGMDGFLALNPRVAIVRHEVMPRSSPLELVKGTIKVVAAMASPGDLQKLDLAKEEGDLRQALAQPGIEAEYVQQAPLDTILGKLSGASVFHFAGHGLFTTAQGATPGTYTSESQLAFFDRRVNAETLAVNLTGKGVRLALLEACE